MSILADQSRAAHDARLRAHAFQSGESPPLRAARDRRARHRIGAPRVGVLRDRVGHGAGGGGAGARPARSDSGRCSASASRRSSSSSSRPRWSACCRTMLIAGSPRPIELAVQQVLGMKAGWLVSVAAVAASIGVLNGWTLMVGRIPYSAAQDGIFFRRLARAPPAIRDAVRRAHTRAPRSRARSSPCTSRASSLLNVFTFLVLLANLGTLMPYLYNAAAALMLARRDPEAWPRDVRIRMQVIALCSASPSWSGRRTASARKSVFWGFLVLTAGAPPVHLVQDLRRGPEAAPERCCWEPPHSRIVGEEDPTVSEKTILFFSFARGHRRAACVMFISWRLRRLAALKADAEQRAVAAFEEMNRLTKQLRERPKTGADGSAAPSGRAAPAHVPRREAPARAIPHSS